MIPYDELLFRFLINLIAVTVLMFVLYYRRHQQKETVIAATLFNIFAFAVLSVLSTAQFGVKVGFGLFAVLALFTLRSEPIKQIDISYFFGCLSIAVLTSLRALDLQYVFVVLSFILIAAYVADHPNILRSVSNMRVTLDSIPADIASSPESLNQFVEQKLGVKVLSVNILSIDYVTEVVRVEVNYQVLK